MKYKLIVLAVVAAFIALVMGLSQADSFNPGTYPRIYRSSATPGATPSSGSGVIWAPTAGTYTGQVSALGQCSFFNTGAVTQYYTVYDSATVATQAPSNALCSVACPAAAATPVVPCICGNIDPVGPSVNGGLVAQNGLTWGSTIAFPGPTASPPVNSAAICTYIVR